jgi:hypothetical protein
MTIHNILLLWPGSVSVAAVRTLGLLWILGEIHDPSLVLY